MSKKSKRLKIIKGRKHKVKKKRVLPSTYTLRQFIEKFWIKGMNNLLQFNPYMSVFQIGVGIELLGSIIGPSHSIDQTGASKANFNYAIQNLSSLSAYIPYINIQSTQQNQSQISKIRRALRQLQLSNVITPATEQAIMGQLSSANVNSQGQTPVLDLYAAMRCGLLHAGVPSNELYLTVKLPTEVKQLQTGKWLLNVKKLYNNFKDACNEVLNSPDQDVQNCLSEPFFQVTSARDLDNPPPSAATTSNPNISNSATVPVPTPNTSNPATVPVPTPNTSNPAINPVPTPINTYQPQSPLMNPVANGGWYEDNSVSGRKF